MDSDTLAEIRKWNPAKPPEYDLVPDEVLGDLDTACRYMRPRGFPPLHIEAIESRRCKLTPAQLTAWTQIIAAIRRRGIVLLHGTRGGGKTQLVTALGVQWQRYGYYARYGACLYRTANGLIAEQIRWFTTKTGAEPIEVARASGLLILDEVNELRTDTVFGQGEMTALLDHRYTRGLPTVLATNLAPSETPKILGWSVIDRIKDRGAVVALSGDNIRDEIRRQGDRNE
jgi:DNA replication protein DnaC